MTRFNKTLIQFTLASLLGFSSLSTLASTHSTDNINLHWTQMKVGDKLPKNAILMSDSTNGPLYFCTAPFKNGTQPGQWSAQGCMISYAGNTTIKTHYAVLTGDKNNIAWHKPNSTYIPNNPIVDGLFLPGMPQDNLHYSQVIIGGYEPGNQNQLIQIPLCRVMYGDTIHLGKIASRNYCDISISNHEIPVTSGFQELYYQNGKNNTSNKHPSTNDTPASSPGSVLRPGFIPEIQKL